MKNFVIKNILESKTGKEYLLNKRKFMDNNNMKIIYEFNEKYDVKILIVSIN
jgi:hypothetical protein